MANEIDLKKNTEVRKAVEAIHTSGDLSFVERKMVNVLLLNAYDNLLEKNKTHSLPVPFLLEMIGWESSSNVALLKELLVKLTTTKSE